jgi:hypothetical protein
VDDVRAPVLAFLALVDLRSELERVQDPLFVDGGLVTKQELDDFIELSALVGRATREDVHK